MIWLLVACLASPTPAPCGPSESVSPDDDSLGYSAQDLWEGVGAEWFLEPTWSTTPLTELHPTLTVTGPISEATLVETPSDCRPSLRAQAPVTLDLGEQSGVVLEGTAVLSGTPNAPHLSAALETQELDESTNAWLTQQRNALHDTPEAAERTLWTLRVLVHGTQEQGAVHVLDATASHERDGAEMVLSGSW
ncbi:MAG: hypothetical protein VX899_22855 [Myxococcota bacterium]|nr:hypothetical protein [Myxococcota bacterium]